MASGSIVFPTTGTPVLGLVAIAISGTATAETITCSDNLGNTWTVVATANNTGTGGAHTAFAYFLYPSAVGSTTATVTVAWGTAVNERFGWFGYTTGHATTSPQDASGTATGTGSATTLTITTSGNLAVAGELALYAFTVGDTSAAGTPPTGWTLLETNPSDATRSRMASFGYQVVAGGAGATLSAGAITFTASSLTLPTGSIVTFKPAGGTTFTDAGTGTVTLSGSRAESQSHTAAVTGTFTFTGAKAESQTHVATGTGTFTFTGGRSESQSHTATASGEIVLTGSSIEQNIVGSSTRSSDWAPLHAATHAAITS